MEIIQEGFLKWFLENTSEGVFGRSLESSRMNSSKYYRICGTFSKDSLEDPMEKSLDEFLEKLLGGFLVESLKVFLVESVEEFMQQSLEVNLEEPWMLEEVFERIPAGDVPGEIIE